MPGLLDRIERYYDALPRSWGARAEEIGPLTLFVNQSAPWPLYARPSVGATAISSEDVAAARRRMRELRLSETFEWLLEVTPALRPAALAAGLAVADHPLLVLTSPAEATVARVAAVPAEVRAVGPDEDLAAVLSAAHVGFTQPDTGVGPAGLAELRAATLERPASEVDSERRELAAGTAVRYAAWADGEPVCTGRFSAVDGVAEIVGIGTVPAYRRRGIGAAVTAALTAAALAAGIEVVFMSAGDADVARIYGRLGFTGIGTACIAEPPAASPH